MDFGKLKTIPEAEKFIFPKENAQNIKHLHGVETKIWMGAPLWANKNWVGKIYPRGTQAKDFLHEYSLNFNSIELNSTHYRIPELSTVTRWRESVPTDFKFCPKFPQLISHQLIYSDKFKTLTDSFLQLMYELEGNLGLSFIQFHQSFDAGKIQLLRNFLSFLPSDYKIAVEVRHESWFSAGFQALTELLEEFDVPLVITDVLGRRDVLHLRLTDSSTLVRFVTNLHPSDEIRMLDWRTQILEWMRCGIENIYFFIHSPQEDLFAPEQLAQLIRLIKDVRPDFPVKLPHFLPPQNIQSELF